MYKLLIGSIILMLLTACGDAKVELVEPDVKKTNTRATKNDKLTIIKSPNDPREYRSIKLKNNLQVLLIADQQADKAAASMDVLVGSGSDPIERQGLAHYLEHMLFLGTQRFPSAGDYQAFIDKHSGSHNAYTSFDHTNYFYDIDPNYFKESLDRFSQFFIAPNFDEKYVDRERNAVHSEYQAKIRNDFRRNYEVFKTVINQQHPLSKFSVGNLDTLDNQVEGKLRNDLIAFYKRFYSADQMKLVLMGPYKLDELETLAKEFFTEIPVLEKSSVEPITEPLFTKTQLPKIVHIEPATQLRQLQLLFPIDDPLPFYKSKPLSYIGNILGHEGKGSLYAYLKKQGWIESLSAGTGMRYEGGATFTLSMNLTEQGLKHTDDITKAVFESVARLKKEGVVEYLFKEQQQLAHLSFQFQEKNSPINTVSSLSSMLHSYPTENVLRAGYLMEFFDKQAVQSFLSQLKPNNLLIIKIAKGLPVNTKTPKYQTPYQLFSLSDVQLTSWQQAGLNKHILLPEPNQFIAENLTIFAEKKEGLLEKPKLIESSKGFKLWFLQDRQHYIPKGMMAINMRSNLFEHDKLFHAKLYLLEALLNDQFNEFAYPALIAGLSYRLSSNEQGLSLKIMGYNDKQDFLLSQLLSSFDKQNPRFNNVKAELLRQLNNQIKLDPYRRSMSELAAVLLKYRPAKTELLQQIERLSQDDIIQFKKRFFSSVATRMLVYGNYRQQDAKKLAGLYKQSVVQSSLALSEIPELAITAIPKDTTSFKLISPYDDSGVVLYLQANKPSKQKRVAASVTGQWLKSDFYTQLRTEKQLGYIVSSGVYPVRDIASLFFVIQSPMAGVQTLQAEIEAFIDQRLEKLDSVDEKTFQRYKSAILVKLQQKPKNLWEQGDRYWNDIANDYEQFDSREQLIEHLNSLTLTEWQVEAKLMLAKASRQALWLLVPGKFPVDKASPSFETISRFKNSQTYH